MAPPRVGHTLNQILRPEMLFRLRVAQSMFGPSRTLLEPSHLMHHSMTEAQVTPRRRAHVQLYPPPAVSRAAEPGTEPTPLSVPGSVVQRVPGEVAWLLSADRFWARCGAQAVVADSHFGEHALRSWKRAGQECKRCDDFSGARKPQGLFPRCSWLTRTRPISATIPLAIRSHPYQPPSTTPITPATIMATAQIMNSQRLLFDIPTPGSRGFGSPTLALQVAPRRSTLVRVELVAVGR